MYLVINKCVTAVKVSNFSGNYLRNRSTLDIGVLGYIVIVQHQEHSPEVLSIPPRTPCITLLATHNLTNLSEQKWGHIANFSNHKRTSKKVRNVRQIGNIVLTGERWNNSVKACVK